MQDKPVPMNRFQLWSNNSILGSYLNDEDEDYVNNVVCGSDPVRAEPNNKHVEQPNCVYILLCVSKLIHEQPNSTLCIFKKGDLSNQRSNYPAFINNQLQYRTHLLTS